jgi:hypothetical protein
MTDEITKMVDKAYADCDFGCWHTVIRMPTFTKEIAADFLNKSRDGAAEGVLSYLTSVWKIQNREHFKLTKEDIEEMVEDAYGHHRTPIKFVITAKDTNESIVVETMFRYLDE